MRSSRWLLLLAAGSLLLLGATAPRCDRSEPLCTLECEYGFKTDVRGQKYCECRDSDVCVLQGPGLVPVEDPVRGECTVFPSGCDIPDGFEPCGPVCRVGDRFVRAGDTVPSPDGCNVCTCLDSGALACTQRACLACVGPDGTAQPIGSTFPAGDDCNTCVCTRGGETRCTERICHCPVDPTPRALCEDTGGRWDPGSCGHYTCGQFPDCDAVVPGCDCGPHRNFKPGFGCTVDDRCRTPECDALHRCPPGSVCNGCPPDPTCPLCAVCGPALCEPLRCDDDSQCPVASHCEGSSVCPPGVVCVWEGRPGICVPD